MAFGIRFFLILWRLLVAQDIYAELGSQGRRRQLPTLTLSSPGNGSIDGGPQRPSAARPVVRHLPALPRRRCSVAGGHRRRAPVPFYEHLGGYAMHELRDFNRHPRWHDDQWRVPPIVTCRLHGNSVLTETNDGSVFVTML